MTTTNASLATVVRILRSRANRVRTGNHMSVARRLAVLDAYVARFNVGRLTAASYLTKVLGMNADFVRRFASGFGKTATAP